MLCCITCVREADASPNATAVTPSAAGFKTAVEHVWNVLVVTRGERALKHRCGSSLTYLSEGVVLAGESIASAVGE